MRGDNRVIKVWKEIRTHPIYRGVSSLLHLGWTMGELLEVLLRP